MKTLNDTQWRGQWRRSSVFLVNCEHTSNFTLILDFERANVYWVHIEKTNSWRKYWVYHALCCSNLSVNKIYQQIAYELIPSQPYRRLCKNFLQRLLQMLILTKNIRGGSRAGATSKMECFVIIVNGFQPLTIITKRFTLDVAAALDPLLKLLLTFKMICCTFVNFKLL